jgi:imidazoleglycerol phosphate dehydratase HisB
MNHEVHRVINELCEFEVATTKLAILISRYYNDNYQHMNEETRKHLGRAVDQATLMQSEMIQANRAAEHSS